MAAAKTAKLRQDLFIKPAPRLSLSVKLTLTSHVCSTRLCGDTDCQKEKFYRLKKFFMGVNPNSPAPS
jgi:hypothetical protein